MRFTKHGIYGNTRMSDALIQVARIVWWDETGITMDIQWINKNGMYSMGLDNIKIKKEHLPNWYEWESK